MIVESIELRNFRHLPFLTIDIPEGTAVIHGNNETGKSTLREAFRLAFSGDPFSSAKGYETLAPWGTKLKAEVTVAFRTADGSRYRVVRSFPKGDASLHRLSGTARDEKDAGALIAEGKGVQEKLDEIIGRGNLETGMSDLLSLSQGETLRLFDRKELPKVFGDEGRLLLKEIVRENLFSGKAERLLGEIGKRKEEIFDTRMNFRKNAVITRLADEYRTMEKTHSALAQKLETEGEKERILAGLEEENRADSVKYSALSDLAKALSAKFDAGADYRNAMDKFSSVKKDHLRILSLHEKNDSNRALLFRTAGEELTRTEGEIAGLRDEVSRLTETEARLAEITAEMKGLNPPAAEQLDLLAGLEDEIRETDTLLSASTVRMEITSPGSEEYEIKADHEEPRRERGNAAVTGSRTIGFRGGPYEIICTGPLPAEEYEKVSKRRELAIREKAGLTKFIGFDSSGEARKVRERYDTLERERSMLTRLLSEKNGPAVKGRISEAAEREKRLRSIIESCPESAKTAARGGAASDRSGSAAGGQRVSADTLLRLIEETERELDRMIGDSSEREITDSYLLLKEETERMARKLAVLPPADGDERESV